MSITTRRRSSRGIVDIWVTNNSDDANVEGSLRNAIGSLVMLGLTNSPTIKFHPDFLDVAGTGDNYTIVGNAIMTPPTVDNLTIDFSGIKIVSAGTGGCFSTIENSASFTNYKNAVVENQTIPSSLFGGKFILDNIIFKNISCTSTNAIIAYGYGSIIRNCYFENVTKTGGGTIIFLNPGRYGIFENNVVKSVGTQNFFSAHNGAVINISKCYITTADRNLCGASVTGRYNFYQNYIEYLGSTGNICVFSYENSGDMINNTLVNIRVSGGYAYGAQTHTFAHNTQIYTRTLSGALNGATLNGNVVKNNIIIAPSTTNIFSTGVTYEESNNLYIAINANANFPNSTHYPASTPLSTLINTVKQGVGETNELYYLPTITNNVARLTDVLINQIYQDRNNPTNIGAI